MDSNRRDLPSLDDDSAAILEAFRREVQPRRNAVHSNLAHLAGPLGLGSAVLAPTAATAATATAASAAPISIVSQGSAALLWAKVVGLSLLLGTGILGGVRVGVVLLDSTAPHRSLSSPPPRSTMSMTPAMPSGGMTRSERPRPRFESKSPTHQDPSRSRPMADRQPQQAPTLQSRGLKQQMVPTRKSIDDTAQESPALVLDERGDRLRAEITVISAIKASLENEQYGRVQVLSAQHSAEFPEGVFAEECEAISALAQCELSKTLDQPQSTARAAARRFLNAHPYSPRAESLRRRCEI